jgi:hypothetical protein
MMKILSVIMSAALLLCLAPMPYGYYTLVRFVSMVVFAAMAYGYWQNEKKPLTVTFGALALLFQPFAKIALGREMWNVVDVIVAIGLIVLAVADKKETK